MAAQSPEFVFEPSYNIAEIWDFDAFFEELISFQQPVAVPVSDSMDTPSKRPRQDYKESETSALLVQAQVNPEVEQRQIVAPRGQIINTVVDHPQNSLPHFDQAFTDSGFSKLSLSAFPSLLGQVQLAQNMLANWKRNEMAKERNLSEVDSAAADYLHHIQTVNNGICESLHCLSPQEQNYILSVMRHTLLVITMQPSCANATRIITTTHNFYANVQLLLDEKFYASKKIVRAAILDQDNQRASAATSGAEIGQLTAELKQDDETKAWCAQFCPRIAKRPRRLEKSSQEGMKTISDENFWVNFEMDLHINGTMEAIMTEAISFPVKIAVHGIQVRQCLETLVWDSAAGNFGVQPIAQRPQKLPFVNVMQAINTRFARLTGRSLASNDFRVIVTKILGPNFFKNERTQNGLEITLDEFRTAKNIVWTEKDENGEEIQKSENLSLWDWFFATENFTTKFLQFEVKNKSTKKKIVHSLWKDRKVMGYISSQSAYATLGKCVVGTFMLRYSTATPSAISIDYKDKDGIYSLRMSENHLKARNLPDRIMRIDELEYLYSSVHADDNSSVRKAQAFRSLSGGMHIYESPVQVPDSDNYITVYSPTGPQYVIAVDSIRLLKR